MALEATTRRIKIPHTIRTDEGPLPFDPPSVYVYDIDTTNQVTVYAGPNEAATLTQPLGTDKDGQVHGWVESGRYDVKVGGAAARTWEAYGVGAEVQYVGGEGGPAFTNGYRSIGKYPDDPTFKVRIERDHSGFVRAFGVLDVRHVTTNTVAFTLPTGWRPSGDTLRVAITETGASQPIRIYSNGNVENYALGSTYNWINLGGIVWRYK